MDEIQGVIIAWNVLFSYADQYGSPEVKSTLSELKRRGLKLAAVLYGDSTENIQKRNDLSAYFTAVCGNEGEPQAECPASTYLSAAEKIGLPAKKCLVIENNPAAIDKAASRDFHNAGIGSASTYSGAEYRINRFVEILGII